MNLGHIYDKLKTISKNLKIFQKSGLMPVKTVESNIL